MSGVGWKRVPVTRLQFDPVCCRCRSETSETRTFSGSRVWYLLVLERIIGLETTLEVPVPFCDACARASRRAWIRGTLNGLATSFTIALGGAVIVGLLRLNSPGFTMALGLTFLAGPFVGYFIARRPDPVALRGYKSGEGTVEIRFENPEVAERFDSTPTDP